MGVNNRSRTFIHFSNSIYDSNGCRYPEYILVRVQVAQILSLPTRTILHSINSMFDNEDLYKHLDRAYNSVFRASLAYHTCSAQDLYWIILSVSDARADN